MKGIVSALHTILIKTQNRAKWPQKNLNAIVDATVSIINKERLGLPKHLLRMLTAVKQETRTPVFTESHGARTHTTPW